MTAAYQLTARKAAAVTKAAANIETRARLLRNYPGAAESWLDSMAPLDWRTVARDNARRRYRRPAIWNPPYTDDSGNVWRWIETLDGSGLMIAEENATESVNGRRVTGYYTDSHGDESQHGVVLATGNPESPRALFFSAINDPCNPGAFRVLWTSTDDLRAAARTADSIAERDAESQREYRTAWEAGQRSAELAETVAKLRREALAILAERRAVRGIEAPNLCRAIRDRLESILDDIRDARAKRRDLLETLGRIGDPRLVAAFNDGAA
jgi:hypothetical protein